MTEDSQLHAPPETQRREQAVFFDVFGCRGSRSLLPARSRIGNCTSCYSVSLGNVLFALDAGRGLTALSSRLFGRSRLGAVSHVVVLVSHSHLDHWEGLKDAEWFWRRDNGLSVTVCGPAEALNAISNGLLALLEHPGELEKLRRNPALVETAADELVRWTTPVNHFVRTAAVDYELRGKRIKAGDSVALFYASANRDEEIFPDPFVFRIDRDPNPHLGFGVGEHFCLGAHLARLDLKVFFRQFVERVESIELVEAPQRLYASFVGGPKHVRVRYRMRPAAGRAAL